MKQTRKGLGIGMGIGYKNLVPLDPYIHSLSAKGVKTIALSRVPYGKESTPKNKREYRMFTPLGSSPVGTIKEWKDFAKKSDIKRFVINDIDGTFEVDIDAKGQRMPVELGNTKLLDEFNRLSELGEKGKLKQSDMDYYYELSNELTVRGLYKQSKSYKSFLKKKAGKKLNAKGKYDDYNFQDTHQEKVIHSSSWHKGNSFRTELMNAGDIFRELSIPHPHKSYLNEKISKVKHYINQVEKEREYKWDKETSENFIKKYGLDPRKTNIHPEDSYEYSHMNNKGKFEKMEEQWKKQPYTTKLQKKAIDLNLAMLKKDFKTAKELLNNIDRNTGDIR